MLTNGLNNLQKLNTCRLCGWRRKKEFFDESYQKIGDGAADDIGWFWFLEGFFFLIFFSIANLIS